MARGKIVACVTVMALVCGTVSAATVSWTKGQSPPASWTLSPASPTSSSVISFSGPLDVPTYGNSCVAESNLGGTPQLTVNTLTRTVSLWFQGPAPTICTLIWQPVCGLEGTFGPLTDGKWTFRCQTLGIEIQFTVGGGGGKVIYVDRSATGPSPNGSSWYRAYRNVQDALAGAAAGDEIRIADGTYEPDQGAGQTVGDREASFTIPDGVTLRGSYAGYGAPNPDARDAAKYLTILSGDLNGDDLWGILNRDDNSYHVVTLEGSAALDGLTIADGQADGPYPHHCGGGILIQAGEPTLANCTVRGNKGVYGGGVAAFGASPYLANCQLSGNRALLYGGALYNHDSTTTLASCLLTGNSAGSSSVGGGSAICNMGGSGAHVTVSNCTLADNVGPWPNEIVLFNFRYSSSPSEAVRINNSILYNSGGASLIWSDDPATVVASYSIIQGGWAGTGNLNVDPRFVSRGLWSIEGEWIDLDSDYHLQATSQGINHGNNSLILTDHADVDGDGNTSENHPLDLAGADRVQSSKIDSGAYEGSAAEPHPEYVWEELRTFEITFDVPTGITFPVTLNGSYSHQVETNFRAELKLEVSATSAAGGTWTAWFDPDPGHVGPGITTVTWRVRGENVDIGQLTPGATDVTVAEVTLYVRPAAP